MSTNRQEMVAQFARDKQTTWDHPLLQAEGSDYKPVLIALQKIADAYVSQTGSLWHGIHSLFVGPYFDAGSSQPNTPPELKEPYFFLGLPYIGLVSRRVRALVQTLQYYGFGFNSRGKQYRNTWPAEFGDRLSGTTPIALITLPPLHARDKIRAQHFSIECPATYEAFAYEALEITDNRYKEINLKKARLTLPDIQHAFLTGIRENNLYAVRQYLNQADGYGTLPQELFELVYCKAQCDHWDVKNRRAGIEAIPLLYAIQCAVQYQWPSLHVLHAIITALQDEGIDSLQTFRTRLLQEKDLEELCATNVLLKLLMVNDDPKLIPSKTRVIELLLSYGWDLKTLLCSYNYRSMSEKDCFGLAVTPKTSYGAIIAPIQALLDTLLYSNSTYPEKTAQAQKKAANRLLTLTNKAGSAQEATYKQARYDAKAAHHHFAIFLDSILPTETFGEDARPFVKETDSGEEVIVGVPPRATNKSANVRALRATAAYYGIKITDEPIKFTNGRSVPILSFRITDPRSLHHWGTKDLYPRCGAKFAHLFRLNVLRNKAWDALSVTPPSAPSAHHDLKLLLENALPADAFTQSIIESNRSEDLSHYHLVVPYPTRDSNHLALALRATLAQYSTLLKGVVTYDPLSLTPTGIAITITDLPNWDINKEHGEMARLIKDFGRTFNTFAAYDPKTLRESSTNPFLEAQEKNDEVAQEKIQVDIRDNTENLKKIAFFSEQAKTIPLSDYKQMDGLIMDAIQGGHAEVLQTLFERLPQEQALTLATGCTTFQKLHSAIKTYSAAAAIPIIFTLKRTYPACLSELLRVFHRSDIRTVEALQARLPQPDSADGIPHPDNEKNPFYTATTQYFTDHLPTRFMMLLSDQLNNAAYQNKIDRVQNVVHLLTQHFGWSEKMHIQYEKASGEPNDARPLQNTCTTGSVSQWLEYYGDKTQDTARQWHSKNDPDAAEQARILAATLQALSEMHQRASAMVRFGSVEVLSNYLQHLSRPIATIILDYAAIPVPSQELETLLLQFTPTKRVRNTTQTEERLGSEQKRFKFT